MLRVILDSNSKISIHDRYYQSIIHTCCILFDPETIHFFIPSGFVRKTDLMPVPLEEELCVSTPNGSIIVVDIVCPSYTLSIGDYDPAFDLMILEIRDFDEILRMDWLASFHTMVDYFRKRVTI